MTSSIPQLVPLQVPWQISSSAPALRFTAEYVDGETYGIVRFTGFLGQYTKLVERHGNYVQVTIMLEALVFASFYPEFSLEDKERLDTYDWSLVPEFRDAEGSLRGSTERFHSRWNETGICPEPAAYWIARSDLLAKLGFHGGQWKHYLFMGDDFNIEAVAQNMKWELSDV